jgi:hypothetical protein
MAEIGKNRKQVRMQDLIFIYSLNYKIFINIYTYLFISIYLMNK